MELTKEDSHISARVQSTKKRVSQLLDWLITSQSPSYSSQ